MKKLFILILTAFTATALAQKNFDQLPVTGSVNAADKIPLFQSGATKAAPFSIFQDDAQGRATTAALSPARYLPHLFDKTYRVAVGIESTNITWLTVGDSVAGFQSGPILQKMRRKYGETGYGFGSLLGVAAGGATSTTTDFAVCLNGYSYTVAGSGQTASFGLNNAGSFLSFPSTVLKIKYIAQSGGGSFKIQTNNDGAGWVDETSVSTANGATALATGQTNISTSNATTIACTATVVKSLGKYQIRAIWVSGSSKIIGAVLLNNTIGGVVDLGLSQGGQSILPSSMGATPQQILVDTLYDLDPTVVSFKCYDDAPTFTSYLDGWYARLTAACPNADWIDISGGPAAGGNDATIIAQNVVHKAKSTALNHFYFDARAIYQTYAVVSGIPGWSIDGTHFSDAANEYAAAVLLSDMSLLSLFNPATSIARLGTGGGPNTLLQVAGDRNTNLTYRLAGTTGYGIGFQFVDASGIGSIISFSTTLGTNGFYLGQNNGVGVFMDANNGVRIGAGDIGMTADRDLGKMTTPNTVSILTAGKTLEVKSGTNALAGTVTLSNGSATITSTSIDANTVFAALTLKTSSGTPSTKIRVAVTAGSATITGEAGDNSTYNWIAFKVN